MLSKLCVAVAVAAIAGSKAAPSVHASAALDAKLSLLSEASAPNHRSKAMEKKATQKKAKLDESEKKEVDHKEIADAAFSKVEDEAYDAYETLMAKCIACKLAEDAVVSQLQLVVSLHDYADEKLDEYNSAKGAAESASTKATSLEGERDDACEGAPEADSPTSCNEIPDEDACATSTLNCFWVQTACYGGEDE
jgi:hypothetical protein